MDSLSQPNRRRFLKGSAAFAIAGLSNATPGQSAEKEGNLERYEFCTFTKAIQHLSYEENAKAMADIGFDGIESAVRPKGQVEPERVKEDLPRLVEALKAKGLVLSVMTSGLNEVSAEQRTEEVLRTAAKLGIKRYRMNYYRYDLTKPIRSQIDEFRPRLKDLVALSREAGIKPIYQNHSGKNYFGGPVWDLASVLDDYSPEEIGVAFDIGHATVEGARDWPLNFARIREHLDTVYLKEPVWQNNELSFGPLGEGAVDKSFYKVLTQSGFRGTVSVHVEYLGHNGETPTETILAAMAKDFATARTLLA